MISSIINKNILKLPSPIGHFAMNIPFKFRAGIWNTYNQRINDIVEYKNLNQDKKRDFIFEKTKNIVSYAYENIGFYREYYNSKKFHPSNLISFENICEIPIINKALLRQYDILGRSKPDHSSYLANTGGSSGSPLNFYIQRSLSGNEWAHMHTIWSKLGYCHKDLKIRFGGRSNIKNFIEYDVISNSLAIDIYKDLKSYRNKLIGILNQFPARFLHGYPSALYEFAIYCQDYDTELLAILRKTLKGGFLGSEYPMPLFRKKIEEVFGIDTISWYGHTESAILAWERNKKYQYAPFQTYGYTEAIQIDNSNNYSLIGTSYYNFASPFIRYDTEDTINNPVFNYGILDYFSIDNGRQGQFILDFNGKKIPLTGLIFGRHHKLFDYCSHIQVSQNVAGKATILFVPRQDFAIPIEPKSLFDTKEIFIDFEFKQISEPIKTISGKVDLLVDNNLILN